MNKNNELKSWKLILLPVCALVAVLIILYIFNPIIADRLDEHIICGHVEDVYIDGAIYFVDITFDDGRSIVFHNSPNSYDLDVFWDFETGYCYTFRYHEESVMQDGNTVSYIDAWVLDSIYSCNPSIIKYD